jgi:hypothetical protein
LPNRRSCPETTSETKTRTTVRILFITSKVSIIEDWGRFFERCWLLVWFLIAKSQKPIQCR